MNSLSPYFLWWRTTVVHGREIVDAVVDPEHRAPSSEFREALARWPGPHYWADGDGEGRLVLIRQLVPPRRERWWLHTLLFLLTFGTVWMGGALLSGWSGAIPLTRDIVAAPGLLARWLSGLLSVGPGLDFAMALMAILLAHETGHYILARRYAIDTSPPYFLPAPPWWNFIGTFGAFIRLRSPILDRRQLMDIGAAGPWAGFVLAMAALVAGLMRSTVVPGVPEPGQFVMLGNGELYLGQSLIGYAVQRLVVGQGTVQLHPLAFAGWVGLLVTMLNLLPLAQLDGGHVLYALIGKRQASVGRWVWVGLFPLGLYKLQFWWWAWALIILILGRGRLAHPQVLDRERPLPPSRRPIGWATMLLFVATFTPAPIHF